jgi:hypothetical protein
MKPYEEKEEIISSPNAYNMFHSTPALTQEEELTFFPLPSLGNKPTLTQKLDASLITYSNDFLSFSAGYYLSQMR